MAWLWISLVGCSSPPLAVADPPVRSEAIGESDRLVRGVHGRVASHPAGRTVWSERPEDALFTRLVLADHGRTDVLVDDHGNPDRPAFSEDGDVVAYVSAASGVAAIWAVRLSDRARVQLTNKASDRPKDGPPPGWLPPPIDDSLRVAGDRVVWTGPDGRHAVALPEGW